MRVRALFVKHTKTGNPLVDSVAEHQPGSPDAFLRYLGLVSYVAPLGVPALLLGPRRDVGLFLLTLGAVSLFFSLRMRRLATGIWGEFFFFVVSFFLRIQLSTYGTKTDQKHICLT